jgi:hypothetical protein
MGRREVQVDPRRSGARERDAQLEDIPLLKASHIHHPEYHDIP